jgi:hypothetical protein
MLSRIALAVTLTASLAVAKEPRFYQKGVLVEMNSVPCGYDEKAGKGFGGAVLGTDSGHRKTKEMLCPEYVLRTEKVIYRIRPKEEKNPVLLPIGEDAEFRIHKDKMKLRVLELEKKERDYFVVSMQLRGEVPDPQTTDAASSR